jgi:hypothetical protein
LNPLTAPFKTPAQLREEAQRMAELSVVDENVLREEQRKQEAGLGALTGTMAGALGGYQQQVTGGLQGLGSMYERIAGGAQTAGSEALAAAGATPTGVPAVSPTVASQFANLAASTSGAVPAAVATGQRLIGESKTGLSRLLADRASRMSANMASFLQDLQRQEYEKAISRETIAQNAARLGISEADLQRRAGTDAARLDLERQRVDQGWARISLQAQSIADRAANREKTEADKRQAGIRAIQNDMLKTPNKYIRGSRVGTGMFEYTIRYFNDQTQRMESVKVTAASDRQAAEAAKAQMPPSVDSPQYDQGLISPPVRGSEITDFAVPNRQVLRRRLVSLLVDNGMNRKAAQRWVDRNMLADIPSQRPGGRN